jgi:cobyrinic acid a,c-diamide synthase
MVSAPASGQGKTSVTAAMARSHARRGRRVRVFKTGPDFIDPMILACASGQPVRQLDLFMGGEAQCRALLHEAAGSADLILVEGAMGLFDGAPSSADLAAAFGLPVLAVIDAGAMAQTFAAIAHGLASFRSDVSLAGVVANRVGSAAHGRMVGESLPPHLSLAAALRFDAALGLPERHLGLVQARELPFLAAQLDRLADAWERGGGADFRPAAVAFARPAPDAESAAAAGALRKVRIGVANDEAFSFVYADNLDTLRDLGAELATFSPLDDAALPACDALWLPGGYPELHAERLEANRAMAAAVRMHHAQGRPILAECGGLLYLADGLTVPGPGGDGGRRYAFAGVLAGEARMHEQLTAIGLQAVDLPEGALRGHSFHHSSLSTALPPIARGRCPNGGRTAEAVFRIGATTASYMHLYFPSSPGAVGRLFHPGGRA